MKPNLTTNQSAREGIARLLAEQLTCHGCGEPREYCDCEAEPVTTAELKHAAQFRPGSVTLAAVEGEPVQTDAKRRPHWTTFAKGAAHRTRGTMNKTEAAYSRHLEGEKVLGRVEWFAFEAVTFRLAKGSSYTPDFLVMRPSGILEAHEVKGFWAEAAKVRIKVAADKFPFRFVSVKPRAKKRGGGWEETEF